jgi:hypothetical protein
VEDVARGTYRRSDAEFNREVEGGGEFESATQPLLARSNGPIS